ncbi:MAG: hypothetical protein KDD82_23680, partial [Planctomycetes bacterium]|nr:hypothetical protein [Planctomycetota bacterium]
DRWSVYQRVLLSARDGDYVAAGQKIVALHTLVSGFELPAKRWTADQHWLRNRIHTDLVHYPPGLRAELGRTLPFLRPLPDVTAAARGGPRDPVNFYSLEHQRAWAHVELTLRAAAEPGVLEGAGLDPIQSLAIAGLLEEAWAALEAQGPPTRAADAAWQGLIAFRLGNYRGALERWQAFPVLGQRPELAPAQAEAQAWVEPD